MVVAIWQVEKERKKSSFGRCRGEGEGDSITLRSASFITDGGIMATICTSENFVSSLVVDKSPSPYCSINESGFIIRRHVAIPSALLLL